MAREHASAIASLNGFAAVQGCCLYGQPRLEDALEGLAVRHTYLVPLLMAEGHTNDVLTERALAANANRPRSVELCRPVGCHPALSDVIAAAALGTCRARGWRPSETGLLLIGHGTPRHVRSRDSLRRHGTRIAERQAFAEVGCAFLDDVPSVSDSLHEKSAACTVAVGFFADAGPHGADDVEDLLAGHAPHVAYAGPIGRDPRLAGLILDQVRQADTDALVA